MRKKLPSKHSTAFKNPFSGHEACENNNHDKDDCENDSKITAINYNFHNSAKHCELYNNIANDCDAIHNIKSSSASREDTGKAYTHERIRLNRAIAASGAASRRKADELIKKGHIRINGKVELNPATQVSLMDRIEIDGRQLPLSPPHVYLMLHKPTHVLTTTHDPRGRKTVIDLLPSEFKGLRVYPVGRLDYFSEGLLLLTNDGELANRLMHPRHHLAKLYEVRVRGTVSDQALKQMENGMCLDGGARLLPVRAKASLLADGTTLLSLELRQGLNRQIRRMCDQLGLVILSLKRVAEGVLELGSLKAGEVRRLTKKEVDALYRATHLESEESGA